MTINTIIKHIMSRYDVSQDDLARALGVTRANIWSRLNRDNMSLSTMCTLLYMLGYRVVICPEGRGVEYDLTEWAGSRELASMEPCLELPDGDEQGGGYDGVQQSGGEA